MSDNQNRAIMYLSPNEISVQEKGGRIEWDRIITFFSLLTVEPSSLLKPPVLAWMKCEWLNLNEINPSCSKPFASTVLA